MRTKKLYFVLFIIFITLSSFAQGKAVSVGLCKSSNVYIKTLLFYLPITREMQNSYKLNYTNNTFESILSIDRENIYQKPIVNEIFCSDIVIRISSLPLSCETRTTITTPVTIRLNKTIIERNVSFNITQCNNKITVTGIIRDLKINDLIHWDKYPKRQTWRMPILLDLKYEIK